MPQRYATFARSLLGFRDESLGVALHSARHIERRTSQRLGRRQHIIVFWLHPDTPAIQHLDPHRHPIQRRTPAVVLWRNSSAVTASASASGAMTSTRNP